MYSWWAQIPNIHGWKLVIISQTLFLASKHLASFWSNKSDLLLYVSWDPPHTYNMTVKEANQQSIYHMSKSHLKSFIYILLASLTQVSSFGARMISLQGDNARYSPYWWEASSNCPFIHPATFPEHLLWTSHGAGHWGHREEGTVLIPEDSGLVDGG